MTVRQPRRGTEVTTRALQQTRALLHQASTLFRINPPALEVRFDLRGQAAGQARCPTGGPALIRYNRLLLEENTKRFLARTVPHEVAHVMAYRLHGPRIRPHGPEWRQIMGVFGAESSRCHDYDVSRSTVRRLTRHVYHCDCREHSLTSIRHNRILAGQCYFCRSCGKPLAPGHK